jgi:hypothetical protein
VESEIELKRELADLIQLSGPCLIEVRLSRGHRGGLSRPSDSPAERKEHFMKFLET